MYDAMLAETVTIRGDGGDEIEAYLARPMSQGPFGGVVVIHHMPGYDEPTKEIARTFAVHGYNAPRGRPGRLAAHLYLVRPLPSLLTRPLASGPRVSHQHHTQRRRMRRVQWALERAQMLMPESTASRSIAASSSVVKSLWPAAARFSSSCATLLAPIRTDVTRGSRSAQDSAS